MKVRFLLIVLTLLPAFAFAQALGGVTGKVVSRQGRTPISGVELKIMSDQVHTVTTDKDGNFIFPNLPEGVYDIEISGLDWQPVSIRTTVSDQTSVTNVGMVTLVPDVKSQLIDTFDDMEMDFESGDAQSMPSVLSASKDIFDNNAGYNFGSMRFRTRGYDSGSNAVYLNGVYFNDALNGYTPWSLWSGLNDATRNQETTTGAAISDYGVGGINGTVNINARASQVREGFRFSLVNASGQYRLRAMATYGSGLLDNGWSYALSVSTRQGGNDWVNGVFYNSWGYFGSVEKRFNDRHSLGLTFFGAPGERAVQSASTQEVYDLVGSNYYNPNWGYQGGRDDRDKRNARIRDNHEPVAMLNYYYTPNERTSFSAAASFRFGRNGYSALDWYEAQDPRPDYYRNLPSYFEGNEYLQNWVEYGWLSDWNVRQLNWDRIYNINQNNYFDRNDKTQYYGGVDVRGKTRSQYVIEERRTDQRDFNLKLQGSTLLSNNSRLTGGFDLRINRTEYYKVIKDLLGGDYYVDIDKFAERDATGNSDNIQNDLDRPNRLLKKGDKYGYDYYAHIQTQKLWGTYRLNVAQFELTAGVETGATRYWREGRVRKGLFPDNSKGKSEKQNFWTYTAKIGATYRINAAHSVYANFARMQTAPYFENVFLSPRTRNSIAPNVTTEKTTTVDLNYAVNTPLVRGRLTGFYTRIDDRMDMINFYNDAGDTRTRTYTNFAMSGIDQVHTGIELGLSVPLTQSLTAEGVLNYGYYKYASNPYVTQTVDNSDMIILDNERVWWKDMKVESTPQTAVSLGLNYRGPNSLFAGINANYFNAMYISMNPFYRTDYAVRNLPDEAAQVLAQQEMYGDYFVLNADVGKMWRISQGYTLGLNLQVKNILNDKNIKTGGYEQTRLERTETAPNSREYIYSRFGSKYYYMFGTTYYLQLYLRF